MLSRFFAKRSPIPASSFVTHTERLISAGGGLLGVLVVAAVSAYGLGLQGAALVIASMGASAVLLFAVPHGTLSQPWPVFGGHVLSAIIGVACYRLIPYPILAAALAVGLAIGVMYYLRCLHPPGGATALTAVIGGDEIHALGFGFVLEPVALNATVILLAATAINYPFKWRRYPARLRETRAAAPAPAAAGDDKLTHEDFAYALRRLDSYIDVSEDDLARIYSLATAHAQLPHISPDRIRLDGYYSNGRYGDDWSVRHVVDQALRGDPEKDQVIYRVVAGKDRRSAGTMSRGDFARWARHEVVRNENSWQKPEVEAVKREEAAP